MTTCPCRCSSDASKDVGEGDVELNLNEVDEDGLSSLLVIGVVAGQDGSATILDGRRRVFHRFVKTSHISDPFGVSDVNPIL